jgi:hypothetical protein
VKINQAKECIKELYLNTNSVTALISERGIGKTSAYQQCAQELGIDYIGLYAAALEGPDFMGLPDKDVNKGITRYLAPQFLPTVQAVREGIYPDKGFLVLEEINRVPSDTISVLYPLLLEKKINGHNLAPGWSIGVTMNPDSMNYLVNSLDDAMLDRFVAIEITASIEDYIDYSLRNRPNDDVLSFLQAFPDMLLIVKKSAESTALTKAPTPRGWTKIQELLNNCILDEKLMRELISGIVGPQAAYAFYGYLENRHLQIPATMDILNCYSIVSDKVKDILRANRLDLMNYIIRKLVASFELTSEHLENINKFVNDLPEELQILFFKYVMAKRAGDMDKVIENCISFDLVSNKIFDILNIN